MKRERTHPATESTACAECEWLVGPYVDGELPPGEAERVERLLEECENCRTLADQFRSLDDLARKTRGVAPRVSGEEWGRVWQAVREAPARRERRVVRLQDWLVPLASVAALLVLGLWLGSLLLQDDTGAQRDPDVTQDSLQNDESPRAFEVDGANVIDMSDRG